MARNAEDIQERATAEADPQKFNLVKYITGKGVVMPEDTVNVYLDVEASREFFQYDLEETELIGKARRNHDNAVAQAIKDAGRGLITDETPEAIESDDELQFTEEENERIWQLRADKTKAKERLLASHSIWRIRGVAPALTRAMERKMIATIKHSDPEVQTDQREHHRAVELVRLAVQEITFPSMPDNNTAGTLSHPDMAEILDSLPDTESTKIIEMAQFLTYAGILTDPKVDAGFPDRRDEPAGEPMDPSDDQGGASDRDETD